MPIFSTMRSQPPTRLYKSEIEYSCRINDDDASYLASNFNTPDNADKVTFSCWTKRCNLGVKGLLQAWVPASDQDQIYFEGTDRLACAGDGGEDWELISTAKFRDVTNWYHVHVIYDSAQAAAADRISMYMNGVKITDFDTETYPDQNQDCRFTKTDGFEVNFPGIGTYDGYVSEAYILDNIAAPPTDFGLFKDGVWIPKIYTGTYGTNSTHLTFSDSSNFGRNPYGADWFDVSLNTNDQVVDTPTNNYAVLNLLDKGIGPTLSDGNLQMVVGAGADNCRSTFKIPLTGKWYFEQKTSAGNSAGGGIMKGQGDINTDGTNMTVDAGVCAAWDTISAHVNIDGVVKNNYWSGTPAAGEWIGTCIDMDESKISFTRDTDGQREEYVFNSIDYDWFPFVGGQADTKIAHFGQQGSWNTPPPTAEYKPFCVKNSPRPEIMKPDLAFDITLHTGDGFSDSQVTDLKFRPDMNTIKCRSNVADWAVHDFKRGSGKTLYWNDDRDEKLKSASGWIKFLNNGFRLKNGGNDVNNAAWTYASWNWKVGPEYGTDIVLFNGNGANRLVPHNLGAPPELYWVKCRSSNPGQENWIVYHHLAPNISTAETFGGFLDLSANPAWQPDGGGALWNGIAPTSTTFSLGTNALVNANGESFVTYLFRGIEGFSKVFSWEGNGLGDGPHIYLGFRPKMFMLKNADLEQDWALFDSVRDPYNPVGKILWPNESLAESPAAICDFLSNSIKMRSPSFNTAGDTYIGIAFAEMPGKWANAR